MKGLIGVDEVGRGSWAGPLLVVAARQTAALPLALADSKTLTRSQRQALLEAIIASCELGEGWVEPEEIDKVGLTAAMRLAVKRALTAIGAEQDELIIMDGNYNYCPASFRQVQCMIKADSSQPIVSAASIYAKVSRDQYMAKMATQYPGYGFEAHVGYGTRLHRQALQALGACRIHRQSYKPVRAFVGV